MNLFKKSNGELDFPLELAQSLLKLDPTLAKLRFRLVPARLKEDVFWEQYLEQLVAQITAYLQQSADENEEVQEDKALDAHHSNDHDSHNESHLSVNNADDSTNTASFINHRCSACPLHFSSACCLFTCLLVCLFVYLFVRLHASPFNLLSFVPSHFAPRERRCHLS